jgi:phosphoribosyl-ATP pyrophosphohydrolase
LAHGSADFEGHRGATGAMAERSIMNALMDVIAERRAKPPTERSYVADLMRGGVAKIGAKIVEEAAEVVEAGDEAGEEGRAHLVHEVADLVFHAAVLLGYRDLSWAAVEDELGRRFGISGISEKEARRSEVVMRPPASASAPLQGGGPGRVSDAGGGATGFTSG